jgi:hypothetical protein
MKKLIAVFAVASLSFFAGTAFADKPETKPYAAGAPFGGLPIWEPGDRFVAISGGQCSGTCPVYELYVFDDGRVVFSGRKDTAKAGVWNKKVAPTVYAELLATLVRTKVLDDDIKRKTCLKGRPVLTVMRSNSDAGDVRRVLLNSGCEGYADLVKEIEGQFIEFTETKKWF